MWLWGVYVATSRPTVGSCCWFGGKESAHVGPEKICQGWCRCGSRGRRLREVGKRVLAGKTPVLRVDAGVVSSLHLALKMAVGTVQGHGKYACEFRRDRPWSVQMPIWRLEPGGR